MGASNAVSVLQYWGHLAMAQRVLLVHMALTALDPPGRPEQPPCLYWGGWELQALAMGYPADDTHRRQLKRLRARLTAAGAIELDAKGTRARSTRWLVNPMPLGRPAEPLPWLGEKGVATTPYGGY
jgi:hypothetical protein